MFRRKLFKTWYLFVRDICVATGKALNNEATPGTEIERWLKALPTEEERKVLTGLGKEFSSDPTPNAHLDWVRIATYVTAYASLGEVTYKGALVVHSIAEEARVAAQIQIGELCETVGRLPSCCSGARAFSTS